MTLAETLISQQEGRSACVYKDSKGLWTIGIGCLVDSSVPGAGLCSAAIEAQFTHDSMTAVSAASSIPGYFQCNEARKAVLVSMCFQLGALEAWPKFRAAIASQDYDSAAAEMLDSAWHQQTPARCELEAAIMQSGIMQDA